MHAIPCLEKWLFEELKCELAQKWHEDAGGRKGLLIKLGASFSLLMYQMIIEPLKDI